MGFYNGAGMDLGYIEEATLLEDVLLPELPPFPTVGQIHDGNEYYPRTIELYEDTMAKFSIPIINPLGDNNGSPTDNSKGSQNTRNISNKNNLQVSSYKTSNYISLKIPRYILLNFISKIPKGTKFLVAFVGGSTDVGDIKIIGVS